MTALLALLLAVPLAAQDARAPMRWRFAKEAGAEEPGRKEVRDRIDAWWKEFEKKHKNVDAHFTGKEKWDLVAWMEKHLEAIHPKLGWEYGPAIKGKGNRLVITCESARSLRPLVEEILKAAPSIPGWEFYPYRPPVALKEAGGMVQGRAGKPLALTTLVSAARGKYNRIDLELSGPSIKTDEDAEKAIDQAFVAVESLAGEEYLDRWVGAIDVVPWPKIPKGLGIHLLKAELEKQVAAVRDSLPEKPLHQAPDDAEWSLLKLEAPAKEADYPAQRDLFVGKAMNVELWKNGRSKADFDSARWSRHGELFCYVKLDGREADKEAFPDKAAIEDALDGVLKKPGLGRFVGGGTGNVYSYVDLAITDLPKAVPAIRQALQKGKVSRRSWILFYDSDLAWEWIGVWDDSPPPPRDLKP